MTITTMAIPSMMTGTHTRDNTRMIFISNVAGSEEIIHLFLEDAIHIIEAVHTMATIEVEHLAILIANRKGSTLILQGITLLIHIHTNTADPKKPVNNFISLLVRLLCILYWYGSFAVTTSKHNELHA